MHLLYWCHEYPFIRLWITNLGPYIHVYRYAYVIHLMFLLVIYIELIAVSFTLNSDNLQVKIAS